MDTTNPRPGTPPAAVDAARRVLDLQTEYARYDENEMILSDHGMEPDRSREDIAADYATALAGFVATQKP